MGWALAQAQGWAQALVLAQGPAPGLAGALGWALVRVQGCARAHCLGWAQLQDLDTARAMCENCTRMEGRPQRSARQGKHTEGQCLANYLSIYRSIYLLVGLSICLIGHKPVYLNEHTGHTPAQNLGRELWRCDLGWGLALEAGWGRGLAAGHTALAGLERGQAWEQWDCWEQALELAGQMVTLAGLHRGWVRDLWECRGRALGLIRERTLVLIREPALVLSRAWSWAVVPRRGRGWEPFLLLGLVPNLEGEVGLCEAIFADLDTVSAPGMITRCTCADARGYSVTEILGPKRES